MEDQKILKTVEVLGIFLIGIILWNMDDLNATMMNFFAFSSTYLLLKSFYYARKIKNLNDQDILTIYNTSWKKHNTWMILQISFFCIFCYLYYITLDQNDSKTTNLVSLISTPVISVMSIITHNFTEKIKALKEKL
jgi:drug/metabolite transporter (DMT)-like permease